MTSTNPETPRRNRRGVALGLTAGLVGGTAAGMVFGIPGLSSAATSDAPAAIVQQADDETDVATTDERPEPGERLRELLQELVDENVISAEQADAVTTHLVENRPERDGRRGPGHHRRGIASEVVLEILGMEADELRAALSEGSSLADVATANGVDPQALIDALVAEAQERIDAAVAEEKIDAERAAELSANVEERVTARVNGERPERPDAAPEEN